MSRGVPLYNQFWLNVLLIKNKLFEAMSVNFLSAVNHTGNKDKYTVMGYF